MKRLILGCLLALGALTQCSAQLQTVGFAEPGGDIPTVESGRNKATIKQGGSTLAEGDKVLDLLYETRATIEYYKDVGNGKLEVFFGNASTSNTKLVAVHAFCKYRPVRIKGKLYAYGVKTYIRADFGIRDRSANITSLFGIGLSASSNKVAGLIQVAVTGISGATINDYISMPGKLDETTITKALEDFAVIKSKLYEEGTKIVPTIIGEIIS